MKLIHMLKATAPGRIEAIRCAVGDTVPAGAVLVEIAPVEIEEFVARMFSAAIARSASDAAIRPARHFRTQ